MNKTAIGHVPNSDDCYAVDTAYLAVKLRAAHLDLKQVTLVYVNKYRYIFHNEGEHQEREMSLVASDERYDYFETTIRHPFQMIDYYFRIVDEHGEAICFGNDVFFRETELSSERYYSVPQIQPADLFYVAPWVDDAVIYQIFPDSFYRGDGESFEGWYRRPQSGDDHLGGTLTGVVQKLDYIESLGANVLYLTPIFESKSSHKYHTRDYFSVDPGLGTEDDFRRLVDLCHARGMKVLLDGVFHSTGTEFFAFQEAVAHGPESDYWEWYEIESFPVQTEYPINYRAWGDLKEMPMLNMEHPPTYRYLQDVVTYWVREYDIDGWRLDTVDALSMRFLREARRNIRAIKPDAIIAGELWYDARPWLRGDALDSVMNYPVTRALVDFIAKGSIGPEEFSHRIGWQRGRYREPAWGQLWNLLSSHDIVRFFTEAEESVQRMQLAVLFQFLYPGVPLVYAGDEMGMTGHSLQGRCGLLWDESRRVTVLMDIYRRASRMFHTCPEFRRGDFREVTASNETGLFAFSRRYEGYESLVIFNVGSAPRQFSVPESVSLIDETPVAAGSLRLEPLTAQVVRYRIAN